MSREFILDTSVLLGITYYSDRWYREAKPVLEADNNLHVSELAVFEYCVSPEKFREPPEDIDEKEIELMYDLGKFDDLKSRLLKPYREYRQEIRNLDREGDLDLESAIEVFVEKYSIRKQAEPQIRAEFEREFAQKAVNAQYINQFVSDLVRGIIDHAYKMKDELDEMVTVHNSVYHIADETKQRWQELPESPPNEPDLSILTDATHITNNNAVSYVLSGDSDFIEQQQLAQDYFGFNILSAADEWSRTKQAAQD